MDMAIVKFTNTPHDQKWVQKVQNTRSRPSPNGVNLASLASKFVRSTDLGSTVNLCR